MNLKLLALTFLIISLAVTPVYAQTVYRVHTDKAINLNSYKYYHFGAGIYVYSESHLRVTAFFEDVSPLPPYTWFNYSASSASKQYIYNSVLTALAVWMNDNLYTEDFAGVADMYWSKSLGVVSVDIKPFADFPANVSIAYATPVPPEEETVNVAIHTYSWNVTTNMTDAILAGSITITDETSGNSTTLPLPTYFSLLKGHTYTLTFSGDNVWNFYAYGSPLFLPLVFESSIRDEFTTDQNINVFFIPVVPPGEMLPVPIIFIFGMVGLACMFVGPIYGINKIKQHEYRQGLVWAVIITALGFSLFIAWLFGGSF